MAELHVLFKFARNPYGGVEIDTTSGTGNCAGLSPFVLGPCVADDGMVAGCFENLWQYSKVYTGQVDAFGWPSEAWYDWRERGFTSLRAQRYPMGKGAVPLYSWWGEEKLGYIEARKRIYAPVYAELVEKTASYRLLLQKYQDGDVLVLRDYDAYDHLALGMTLTQVLNNPAKKCGHAFVLAMMLTGERAWEEE